MALAGKAHLGSQKAPIKRGVVGDADMVGEKGPQAGHHFLGPGPVPDHRIGDTGERGDKGRYLEAWVHQFAERAHDFPIANPYRRDLDDAINTGVEAGGFKIDDRIGVHEQGMPQPLFGSKRPDSRMVGCARARTI